MIVNENSEIFAKQISEFFEEEEAPQGFDLTGAHFQSE
jgi:hypothetical protein